MLADPELIGLARSGDRRAAGRLVESVWPDAYRVARAVIRDHQASEDAAQEACIQMLNSLHHLRDPAAFQAWFLRIAVRAAYREVHGWRREVPLDKVPDRPAAATAREQLREAFACLRPGDRLVLVLHYFYGFTSGEIAAVSGVAAGTVRYRMWTARRRLRGLLLEEDQGRGDSHGSL